MFTRLLSLVLLAAALPAHAVNTGWGSPITFSWEREGRTFDILDHYGPSLGVVYKKHGVLKNNAWTLADWKLKNAAYPKGQPDAKLWRSWKLMERRAFMIANGLRYEHMKKLSNPIDKNSDADGWQVHEDMNGDLTSETNDQGPYKSFEAQMRLEVAVAAAHAAKKRSGRTWETNHKSYGTDLALHFKEVDWLAKRFGGAPLGVSIHMHVAFRRPANQGKFATQLATLASHLNDRATLVSSAASAANMHNRYLGPYDSKLKGDLIAILEKPQIPYLVRKKASSAAGKQDVVVTLRGKETTIKGAPVLIEKGTVVNVVGEGAARTETLVSGYTSVFYKSELYSQTFSNEKAYGDAVSGALEHPDADGHQVGNWKFAKIALRHHYRVPEILGFEFRSYNDDVRKSAFGKVVKVLQDWNPARPSQVTLMLGEADAAVPVSLQTLVDESEHMTVASCDNAGDEVKKLLLEFLTKATQKPIGLGGKEFEYQGSSYTDEDGKLLSSWCIPFVKWEKRAQLSRNVKAGQLIETERAAFVKTLKGIKAAADVLAKAREKKTRIPVKPEAFYQELVEGAVQSWAAATKVYQYM